MISRGFIKKYDNAYFLRVFKGDTSLDIPITLSKLKNSEQYTVNLLNKDIFKEEVSPKRKAKKDSLNEISFILSKDLESFGFLKDSVLTIVYLYSEKDYETLTELYNDKEFLKEIHRKDYGSLNNKKNLKILEEESHLLLIFLDFSYNYHKIVFIRLLLNHPQLNIIEKDILEEKLEYCGVETYSDDTVQDLLKEEISEHDMSKKIEIAYKIFFKILPLNINLDFELMKSNILKLHSLITNTCYEMGV